MFGIKLICLRTELNVAYFWICMDTTVNPQQFVYKSVKQVCWTQRCYFQLVHGVLGQQITIWFKPVIMYLCRGWKFPWSQQTTWRFKPASLANISNNDSGSKDKGFRTKFYFVKNFKYLVKAINSVKIHD